MQPLAKDVGSLSRVLSNVKTRGILGEVQLVGPARAGVHDRAVRDQRRDGARHRRARRVRDQAAGPARRRRAALAADRLQVPARGLRAAARGAGARRQGRPSSSPAAPSSTRLRLEARTIREKYVAPPHTTDFAIMFLPTEGLYAEALRRPGPGRGAAARAPRHAHRADDAAGDADQPADGLSHAGAREAHVGGLGDARRGQDRVRQVRRRARQDQEEARRGEQRDRTRRVRTRAMARELRNVEAMPDERAQALLPGGLFDDDA